MIIPKPTIEEQREELQDILLELCGDVLLLDCLLFPGETENRPGLWESQAVRAALCRRLTDYVKQHVKDVDSITNSLKTRNDSRNYIAVRLRARS